MLCQQYTQLVQDLTNKYGVKISMKKFFKKNKKEEGQAMLEFVLVIPVFLLCLFMIIDFGWLFFNYITIENSARNAARVACVEYTDVCFNQPEGGGDKVPAGTKVYSTKKVDYDSYTLQEKHIVDEVNHTVTDPKNVQSITVTYTADTNLGAGDIATFEGRVKGDVQVVVKYKIFVFSPILGSNGMNKILTSTSTFRVESNGTG